MSVVHIVLLNFFSEHSIKTRQSSYRKLQETYCPCRNLSKHNLCRGVTHPVDWEIPHPLLCWMGGGGVPHPVMTGVPTPGRDSGPVEVLWEPVQVLWKWGTRQGVKAENITIPILRMRAETSIQVVYKLKKNLRSFDIYRRVQLKRLTLRQLRHRVPDRLRTTSSS